MDFFLPTQEGQFELTEKKSRFIGQVWQIQSEDQARAHIEATRKRYHDARHHCWCYRMDDRLVRYSDDGEPQGTAGQPMLNFFTQESIQQVCCVVTRYFGGTLLGTGGLVRAYTHTAKGAMEAAGRSVYLWQEQVEIILDYPLLEGVQRLVEEQGATIQNTEYGVDVTLSVLVLAERCDLFLEGLTQRTSGQVLAEKMGQVSHLVPWQEGEEVSSEKK